MKTWQIFVVGTVALVAAVLLPAYEAALAGIGALVVVSVILLGFVMRPRTDVFYVTTTIPKIVDGHFCIEHECIAVRVEVARLWLLFVPTFSAAAFLSVTYARGSIWNFSLLGQFFENAATAYILCRAILLIIIGVLSTWINERWVLRDADARSAASISRRGARVSYAFIDRRGEYYGGDGLAFGIHQPPEIATLILYNTFKPQLNKIGMAFLFHRLVIIGRGVTDLGEATAAARAQAVQAAH